MILKYFDRAFTFLYPSVQNQRMLICWGIVPRNTAFDNNTARCVNFCYDCRLFPCFSLPQEFCSVQINSNLLVVPAYVTSAKGSIVTRHRVESI